MGLADLINGYSKKHSQTLRRWKMTNDFDEEFDDEEFDDANFTEDEIAEIKLAEQDINMGFTFTSFHGEDGKWYLKCDKCQRTAEVGERPFPHKYECPMKR